MAPKYKLTYFNTSGVAEPIRYIFAYANKEFEDIRIKKETWPQFKRQTPFGRLPLLEVDGKTFNQSGAIARYLAKQFGLAGKDDLEALQAEALVDTFMDLKALVMNRLREKNEEKVAEIKKEEKFYFERFEKIVSDNPSGFLVGSQVLWADLLVASLLSAQQERYPDTLKPYPSLSKLAQTVNNLPSIKAYLEKRPESDPPPFYPLPK